MVKNGNACHLFFRVPEIGTEVPRVTVFGGKSTGNYRLTVLFRSGQRGLNSLFLSLKSHIYADFELVVMSTTNPSPTTILNFRRPMDGFFIASERKTTFFRVSDLHQQNGGEIFRGTHLVHK